MRNRSRTGVALVALLVASVLLSGCVALTGFKAKGQQTLSATHVPDSGVDVSTQNGSVQIAADDSVSDVVIVATITAAGDTQEEAEGRLAAVQVTVHRDANGALTVFPTFPEGHRSNDSCSFDITIPGANGAKVHTSNGTVTLIGLAGNAEVHTSNGSIQVEDQGGAVKARTSNGRVRITDAGGEVDAQSSNGSIDISGLADAAVVRTSNGRVICRAIEGATGPIQIKTSNGSVILVVPASLGGTIIASTSNGGIDVSGTVFQLEGSKHHRTIRLGESGAESYVETSNGSVTVAVEGADTASVDR